MVDIYNIGHFPLTQSSNASGEAVLMTRDYCGNVIYRDGALERVLNDYGYMDSTGNYHYYIKDYQGNVRAVIDHYGTLEEVNNYYPYGALMGGGTVGNNASVQPYKYGTKELERQNGLDWYDSQARMYDPLLGRTPTMDPKAEKYYSISPYAWCSGNPILFVDPTGQFYTDNIKDDTIYPLIAFFPSERDKALEIDYQVAREQNVPMFVVDNLNDFVDAMSCLTDMLSSTAVAIAINSHGSPGSFYVGETRIDGLTDLTDLKNILEGTEVFLGSCNTGTGIVGEQFTQHFSRETGTITVSSRHPIYAGYRYNGGLELGGNGHPYINQFLGLDGENTFMVSEMGSKSNEVYNVRIDKNFGISWETGLYYEAVRPYTIINNLLKKGL